MPSPVTRTLLAGAGLIAAAGVLNGCSGPAGGQTVPPTPSSFGQAPGASSGASIAISGRDRFYTADQFSNTVSVIDPSTNRLLGVIPLGDPTPGNVAPLYKGQLLVHGMGFSPDHRTLLVVSIGSNSVSFIDTATNTVKHTTYLQRSPHEAFFTPDGREVWVSVRGEDHITILDAATYKEVGQVQTPNGPGMTIFSPDGAYAYTCSSFVPETVVIDVRTRAIAGRVAQPSPFCPNIAAAPDGDQVWFTLKDTGKTAVFSARPPFNMLRVIDTGPITNHVNFVRTRAGQFAYVTVGGLNQVKVFRTDTFAQVATIPVGALPHGLWPSGDGTRVYVGLENGDEVAVIDTASNTVTATIPIGQAPQGVAYVPDAAPVASAANLQLLGTARGAAQLSLVGSDGSASQVTLFEQGLIQVLQAAVTGLRPDAPYILALSSQPSGAGPLQPLSAFTTDATGAKIVNTIGPVRQLVRPDTPTTPRYLVIATGTMEQPGTAVQVQR